MTVNWLFSVGADICRKIRPKLVILNITSLKTEAISKITHELAAFVTLVRCPSLYLSYLLTVQL